MKTALGRTMNTKIGFVAGFALAISMIATSVFAQDKTVHGFWEAEEDGRVSGWFLFYEKDGQYQGALVRSFDRPGDPVYNTCTRCPDDQKNAPMIGLVIVKNMQRRGLVYENGNILDPRDGSIYKAKMELSPDNQKLTVRGFLGIELFGQSRVWRRLPDTAVPRNELPQQLQAYLPATPGQKPPTGAKTQNMAPQNAPPQPRRQ